MQRYALKSALIWGLISLGPDLLVDITFSSLTVFAVFLLFYLAAGYTAAYLAFRYMGATFLLCRSLGRNAGALTGLFSALLALLVPLARIFILHSTTNTLTDNAPFGLLNALCLIPLIYLICGAISGWLGGVVYYTQRRIISRR